MFRTNQVINKTRTASIIDSKQFLNYEDKSFPLPSQKISIRFLDIFQLGNKQAIEKEHAWLADELNGGYIAYISELKKHGSKIALANKIIILAMAAIKFPNLDVSYSDGRTLKLPICFNGDAINADKSTIPKASYYVSHFLQVPRQW